MPVPAQQIGDGNQICVPITCNDEHVPFDTIVRLAPPFVSKVRGKIAAGGGGGGGWGGGEKKKNLVVYQFLGLLPRTI